MTLFINSYVESKFQLSRFYRFSSYKRINLHLPKLANKNKGATCSREVPIAEQMVYLTFMWELTANNFYQRNNVDLEPVPIIRFKVQFGFWIVWNWDPSGFGILKCPSLFPVGSNQTLLKLVLTASLLDVQRLNWQCGASTVSGWQVLSKKCCRGDEPSATLCPILPARDLKPQTSRFRDERVTARPTSWFSEIRRKRKMNFAFVGIVIRHMPLCDVTLAGRWSRACLSKVGRLTGPR